MEERRNPIKYKTLKELGINPSTLEWKPMPEPANPPDPSSEVIPRKGSPVAPLTIVEAKNGLALTFGIAPEAIEITIRG